MIRGKEVKSTLDAKNPLNNNNKILFPCSVTIEKHGKN